MVEVQTKRQDTLSYYLIIFGEEYEPGDCVVVLPQNDPAIVDLLISTLGWSPETQVLINEDGDTFKS